MYLPKEEILTLAKYGIPNPINRMRPISDLIAEGSIVNDPVTGEWVLDESYLGNYRDAKQIAYLEQTGNLPCRGVLRYPADVDTSLNAASKYSQVEVWFLGQYKSKTRVLDFIVENYYFKRTWFEGANGMSTVGTSVDNINNDKQVFFDASGILKGKLPKVVAAKLEQLEQLGIKQGCYYF
jgi:hypothetical protein